MIKNITDFHFSLNPDFVEVENEASTIGLKIEPLNLYSNDEFEAKLNNLRAQLKFHNIQMTNKTYQNKEEGIECEIQLHPEAFSKISVCQIQKDGKCLFGAAVHQRYHVKIDSEEYKQKVAALRMEVVAHIEQNLKRYERKLFGRIYNIRCNTTKKQEIQNIDEDAKIFLKRLSNEGFWGGPETIQAISELFKANLVVFNEWGDVSFGHFFDSSYEGVIILAFRVSNQNFEKKNVSNTQRNHYDSIVKLSNDILDESASILLENHAKLSSLQSSSEIINIE